MKYQVFYAREMPRYAPSGVFVPGQTHVYVRTVEGIGLDDVFREMQGEVWSPNGEARMLIEYLGLSHTSMSVGDVAVTEDGEMYVCKSSGWMPIYPDDMTTCLIKDAGDDRYNFGTWRACKALRPDQWQQIVEIASFVEALLAFSEQDEPWNWDQVPDALRVGDGLSFVLETMYGPFIARLARAHEVYI